MLILFILDTKAINGEGAILDSSITEEIAINKLNGVLLKTKIIKPEIKSNDKYPSWDGELLVYKSSSLVKSNLEARVPVQVKGHYSEEPFEKEISYAYDIDDLNNYFIDGGVFFFVIFINETDLFAIYYDELLPFDLKKLIHKASIKNTKTISTKLKIIPDNNHKYLLTQIKNFILNREKQAGKIKLSSSDTPKDINVDQLTFNLVDIRNFNDLFEQPV
ncbi:hypothetical protein SDC9_77696 [bioreactor metagenome]|uniref:DUF4365 domain-containing protein n=1 Tax=bioreactor metagenome TaxID=1076179 RepID=A0A644YXE3_9ZZZZ